VNEHAGELKARWHPEDEHPARLAILFEQRCATNRPMPRGRQPKGGYALSNAPTPSPAIPCDPRPNSQRRWAATDGPPTGVPAQNGGTTSVAGLIALQTGSILTTSSASSRHGRLSRPSFFAPTTISKKTCPIHLLKLARAPV
jgi:hypothetical protein